MAELKDKVEDALNEGRMLVLGVQVLLGFQYQVVFQSEFPKLTPSAQYLHLVGLSLLLLTLVCLMAPAAFHQLAIRGWRNVDFGLNRRFGRINFNHKRAAVHVPAAIAAIDLHAQQLQPVSGQPQWPAMVAVPLDPQR